MTAVLASAGFLSQPAESSLPSVPSDIQDWLIPRPWLALYGNWLRKTNGSSEREAMQAPIQRLLGDDIMRKVFQLLNAQHLAAAGMTCKHWKRLTEVLHLPTPPDPTSAGCGLQRFSACHVAQHEENEGLWKRHCDAAFSCSPHDVTMHLYTQHYGSSWKKMYLKRPFIRCDGVYVSRNTYFRLGQVHWDVKNPVHLVVYYSDGTCLTRTSPEPLKVVWKSLREMPNFIERKDSRLPGRWKVQGATVYMACVYPGSQESEMRCRMRLRTRSPGLNNRLDISDLFTYDRTDGTRATLDNPEVEDDTQDRTDSQRGRGTLVFVPWSQVNTHIINLHKSEMDVWIPG